MLTIQRLAIAKSTTVNTVVAVGTAENDVVEVDLSMAMMKKNGSKMGVKMHGRIYFHGDHLRTKERNFMSSFV